MYARIPAPKRLYDDAQVESDSDAVSITVSERDCPVDVSSTSSNMTSSLSERDGDKKDTVSSLSAPKNVPKHLWEKFQQLEKRTDDVTRRSTARRIQHIQNDVMNKVYQEISNPDDLDILRAHDVKFGPPNEKHKKRKRKKPASTVSSDARQTDVGTNTDVVLNSDVSKKTDVSTKIDIGTKTDIGLKTDRTETLPPAELSQLNQYMGVNDHLKGLDHGKYAPRTALEEKISEAVALGDVETAERLSDHLATREFGKRVCEAIDARAYVLQKKKEEESAKARKKKKLAWGFLHKEKWETKGNM